MIKIDTSAIMEAVIKAVNDAILEVVSKYNIEYETLASDDVNFVEIEAYGEFKNTFKAKVEADKRYGIDFDTFNGLSGDTLLLKQTYAMLAYNILKRSLYYTPIDTGTLRKSSYIKNYGKGYMVGFDCSYATYVHEIGDNEHAFPTRYKFLEDAAFEVLNEYTSEGGEVFPLKITYDPLAIYIGDRDAPGFFLAAVKSKEEQDIKRDAYLQVLNDFYNFDSNTATKEQIQYHNIALKFFDYYRGVRHRPDDIIARHFSDRMRHDFLNGTEGR